MSVPHTGKLTARIGGAEYRFDGTAWRGPDAGLVASLNAQTKASPHHHHTIYEFAVHVLRQLGLHGRTDFVEVQGDSWKEDLPTGAID